MSARRAPNGRLHREQQRKAARALVKEMSDDDLGIFIEEGVLGGTFTRVAIAEREARACSLESKGSS